MLLGVVYQLLSIVFESARITLVQILIQRKGLRLNPITARPVCWQAYLSLNAKQEPRSALKGRQSMCTPRTETGYT